MVNTIIMVLHSRNDLYDVLVNAADGQISIASHAKGKFLYNLEIQYQILPNIYHKIEIYLV